MASIFKRKHTVVVNGKRVKKQSQCWHIKYRDVDGLEQRVKGFTDKMATRQLAAQLEREAELGKAGIIDRYKEHRKRSLVEHLREFKVFLLARGDTLEYAELTFSRVKRVVDGCHFVAWGDISASQTTNYIAELNIAPKTRNYYLQSTKQFCRWMVQDGRASESPLQHLRNKKTDRTYRRALGPDELRTLLDHTQTAPERFKMTGEQRVVLYLLAVESGLRANELRSLTVSSFNIENHTVTVDSGSAKNRQSSTLPLRARTTTKLQEHFKFKPLMSQAFDLPSKYNMADMLRADLHDAGISYSDKPDSPNYINFHSLRHTTGTLLAASGVHPKVAQSIMRHSDINLTMSRYTHTLRGQEAKAIENLPDLLLKVASTGTDNRPVDVTPKN